MSAPDLEAEVRRLRARIARLTEEAAINERLFRKNRERELELLNASSIPRLYLPNADRGAYAHVIDPNLQYSGRAETSSRHRVKNNLPGTPDFCPLVFRTEALNRFIAMDLRARAHNAAAAVPRDLLARTAAFLLMKDSKSSFAIEGEHPPQDRIQRWGRAIGQAGRQPIDLDELLRLQRIVIGDARFAHLWPRKPKR
jgi:hypothetical protein